MIRYDRLLIRIWLPALLLSPPPPTLLLIELKTKILYIHLNGAVSLNEIKFQDYINMFNIYKKAKNVLSMLAFILRFFLHQIQWQTSVFENLSLYGFRFLFPNKKNKPDVTTTHTYVHIIYFFFFIWYRFSFVCALSHNLRWRKRRSKPLSKCTGAVYIACMIQCNHDTNFQIVFMFVWFSSLSPSLTLCDALNVLFPFRSLLWYAVCAHQFII